MRVIAALIVSLALSACVTAGPPPGAAPPRGEGAPSGALALGEYQRGDAPAQGRRFAARIADRYAAGAPFRDVMGDLRASAFRCGPSRHKLGDPPDQVCRRTMSDHQCTHTWQVFLYDGAIVGRLERVRGVYDRACGPDRLLGGRA